MDLPSKHVFEVLESKGIKELYHANSVATACQFLRSRSLMSRGTVERMGVAQTPQKSDDADKRYSIWFDIFMDSVDIHARAGRANLYGPVLFVLDIRAIEKNNTGRLWVTKLNPTKWSGRSGSERWFQDKQDLEENFVVGRFDQMVVARHCGGELPFKRFLKKIVLDEPNQKNTNDVDVYSMAIGALRLAMQDARIDVPIEKRCCKNACKCQEYWGSEKSRLSQMFDPKI